MARLQDLLAKRETLEREIVDTQRKERSAAIAHIATIMDQYGLTVSDLSGKGSAKGAKRGRPPGRPVSTATGAVKMGKKRTSTMKGKTVPAKFRNKATGESWSGRGLQPRWLSSAIASGKKLADFAV